MSNDKSTRKDYETFSSPPVKKSIGDDSSLTAPKEDLADAPKGNRNFRTDTKSLVNLAKINSNQLNGNFVDGLSPSAFSVTKKQRESEIANAHNFGGVSKDNCQPVAKSDGRKGDFVSEKNVVRQKDELPSVGANQSLSKTLPIENVITIRDYQTFGSKTKSKIKSASDEVLEAGLDFVETAKKAISGETSELSYADEQELRKRQKAENKDNKLLGGDRWLDRNGHTFTYIGLFLFTSVVYFRPYEWVPGMEGFTSIALIFAIITLLFYLPTQLAAEGSLTIATTEVKCVLFFAVWSVFTFAWAKDIGLAWKTYNETFIKILLVFIVMVNALRTKERLKGLMWLSISVGVMLSFQALQLYNEGKFEVEGYRVNPDFGGMFGNPNDTALHLVIFIPIALVLGLTSKNFLGKLIYFGSVALMVMANFVMQSRGGFLGLIAVSAFLIWKLSKNNRLVVVGVSLFIGFLVITFAPGNYWLRIASIFDPSLDPVGSSDQRRELLERSILVTLRNPLGIGLGCFPVVGVRDLQTHNAFTQISSELGWLGLGAYLTFLLSPFRKLGAMERQLENSEKDRWMYYLAIGLQASIIGYMVSSFFVSVAYQWFVYFPIAYAICLRRIYKIQQDSQNNIESNYSEKTGLTGWLRRDEFFG